MPTWQFNPVLNEARRQALLAAPTFTSIAAEIERDLTVLCCHRQPCHDTQGFARAVYCFQVEKCLFDIFFNSQNGYRGAYYKSPDRGEAANALLIDSVRHRLADWARQSQSWLAAFAEASMAYPSAKIWLAECGAHFCHKCEGEWSPPAQTEAEILNGRWENAASTNASWGRTAPYLTKIKVMGAFINDRQDKDFVPVRKRSRSLDIYRWGWS